MPVLYDLANETLENIFRRVLHQPTLYALCLTSRRVREAALPSLYEAVHLNSQESQEAFVGTLKKHPELRFHVKGLSTQYWGSGESDLDEENEGEEEGSEGDEGSGSEEELDEEGSDDEEEPDEEDPRAEDPEAQETREGSDLAQETTTEVVRENNISIGELLDLLPKLDNVNFCSWESISISKLLNHDDSPSALVTGLRHLTSLSLTYDIPAGGFPVDAIISCFTLPALRKFHVQGVYDGWREEENDNEDEEELNETRHGTSGVVDLSIEEWDVTSKFGLINVLRMSKGLRTLSLKAALCEGIGFTSNEVLRGLEGSVDTLESLSMINVHSYQSLRFESFADFMDLTSLETQLGVLTLGYGGVGNAVVPPLPESLEVLTLVVDSRDLEDDHTKYWEALVRRLKVSPPSCLQQLRVRGDSEDLTEDEVAVLNNRLRVGYISYDFEMYYERLGEDYCM